MKSGAPGGTFPRAVVWTSDTTAYVASQRDREVIALSIGPDSMAVTRRIATIGQPVALLATPHGRLFAALDNTDSVAVIDAAAGQTLETIPTAGPPSFAPKTLGGAGTNALSLSPDGRTLLVSNGGENALAVIRLDREASGLSRSSKADSDGDGDGDDDDKSAADQSATIGLIPTGWYPTAVAASQDGRRIFVVNGKSNTGPVPGACRANLEIAAEGSFACEAANQYVWQLEKAGFLTLPVPSAAELGALTRQVASNNHVASTRSRRRTRRPWPSCAPTSVT